MTLDREKPVWVEFVDPDGKETRCEVTLCNDGSIATRKHQGSGLCDAYLCFSEMERYRLGFRTLKNGHLSPGTECGLFHEVAIEPVEQKRLCQMVKNAVDLELSYGVEGKNFEVQAKLANEPGLENTSSFCIKTPEDQSLKTGDEINCSLDVAGLSFMFTSTVLAFSKSHAVLTLPTKARRVFKRTAPRSSKALDGRILKGSKVDQKVRLENISYFGATIECKKPLSLWQRIELELSINSKKQRVFAIVVRLDGMRAGVLISSQSDTKTLYYEISRLFLPEGAELTEDALNATSALKVSGYFDLLEAGNIIDTSSDCEHGWLSLKDSQDFIQPVVMHDNKPIGTSSTICAYANAWTGHSFGVISSAKYLYATKILRMGLRVYQMMRGRPSWYVGQYDDSKGWVGRFYKVFLDEHKNYKGVVTWVRKRYWCKKTRPYKTSLAYIEAKDLTKRQRDEAYKFWRSTYGDSVEHVPALCFEESCSNEIRRAVDVVTKSDKIIAVVHSMSNPEQLNPLSVFNDLALYATCDETRKNSELMSEITRCCIDKQFQRGVKTTGIGYDANFEVDITGVDHFLYFCSSRYISSSSIHLPALMSNDALTLEDIYWRNAVSKTN